jgi:deazaflavin-dependent oxidoreductase (nitroreductase family)
MDVRIPERWWPLADRLFKGHVALYRATGGAVGHRFPGAPPMLLLDHVGAKTGKLRATPLAYVRDGDDYVIVASKGGHPKHPAWFHNVLASPEVRIQVGHRRMSVRAREATPEEHERLWPKVVEAYAGYASYQARTERTIPLVILEPAANA